MKKLFSILAVVSLLILGGCSSNDEAKKETPKEEITLTIKVNDQVNQKELLNEEITVKGNVKTLADFLEKAEKLDVVMEDGQYGKTIMSIMGLKTEDFNTGPWWLYESENNKACKAAGQCDAASNLKVEDGDVFTFNYTATF